jgi:hypothetical protein
MKKTQAKEGTPDEKYQKAHDSRKHSELKTDYPLSEKDEIKQAEEKMRKASKKHSATDLLWVLATFARLLFFHP